ncbi:MAG TPA: porin [Candidatus Manganitrophaceae bacterium]|nr:porin [Candidatus Manganitrophaceae bacterium]
MKMRWGWSFAVALFMMAAGSVFAEEAGKSPVQISGFVDTYYSYNLNQPDDRNNDLANFDFDHNTFSLSLAEVVFSKAPAEKEPVGFRIDLDFGPTTDFVHGASGITSHPPIHPVTTESEIFKNVQQAYVTWATPIGLTFDMGKFVTHMGAEVIESKDNWNYTRGLLFCCAIPYYHAGLRVNYPISDMVFVNGYVYNGWNNVVENNNAKTFGAQIGFTPTKRLPIILNWIGPEDGLFGGENLQVYDAIATLNLTDQLALMVNYDYGTNDAAPGGGSQSYSGIAAYARWAMERSALAARYETFNDDDGIVFGAADNTVQEFTVTAEHKVAGSLLLRLEYRQDMADADIFDDEGGGKTDSQSRVVAGVVYTF